MCLCERSEAISLVWSPLQGDCRVANAPRKDGVHWFKFFKSEAKQSSYGCENSILGISQPCRGTWQEDLIQVVDLL